MLQLRHGLGYCGNNFQHCNLRIWFVAPFKLITSDPMSLAPSPFFLPTPDGARFCIFYPPAPEVPQRGQILYVHAFAEEMHKSRRMSAMQARAFAAEGFGVLQIDLLGCGDSAGDFVDARWEAWKRDIDAAVAWLRQRGPTNIYLWGLRTGGLLALDWARGSDDELAGVILWQPVTNGEQFMTQFLRLKLASDMMAGGEKTGTRELRALLARGEVLEVGGYALHPQLAASMDALHARNLGRHGLSLYWYEVVPPDNPGFTPAGEKVRAEMRQQGASIHAVCVTGQPFWAAQELVDCPEIIAASTTFYRDTPA